MKKLKVLLLIGLFSITFTACAGQTEDNLETNSGLTNVTTESETTESETTEQNVQADNTITYKSELESSKGLVWFGNVRNDKTGKWRLSEYASNDSQETFAAEYYKDYFSSDEEIHALINMTNKTTARVTVLMDDYLDVCIYEYIDGEEHDANSLFSGTKLSEYFVTVSTNEIEVVE